MTLQTLPFWLVDLFAREPASGNGLSVFLLDEELPVNAMQRITQEMRQFETIFLRRIEESSKFNARIFTMSEFFSTEDTARLEFSMPDRSISAVSRRQGKSYVAKMDQGEEELPFAGHPIIGATALQHMVTVEPPIPAAKHEAFLEALNLSIVDLAPDLPLQVVSTGLPYLIVPIKSNLEHAKIIVPDLESMLSTVGAKFIYVLHVDRLEGRTWENDGSIEDIATGSAAGPARFMQR